MVTMRHWRKRDTLQYKPSLDKVKVQGDLVKSESVSRVQHTCPTLPASLLSSESGKPTRDGQARSWRNNEVQLDYHSSDDDIPAKPKGDAPKSMNQARFSPKFTVFYMSLKQQSLNRAALAKLMAENAQQGTLKEIMSDLDTRASSPTRFARRKATEVDSNNGFNLVSESMDFDTTSSTRNDLTDLYPASEPMSQFDGSTRPIEEPFSLEGGASYEDKLPRPL
jgi:hypothetical protein